MRKPNKPVEPTSHSAARCDSRLPMKRSQKIMKQQIIKRLLFLVFLALLISVGVSGFPLLQGITLAVGLAASIFVAFKIKSTQELVRFASYAIAGALAFAAWNLLGQPNERWAHRTFIYSLYGAAAALFLLATDLGKPQQTDKQKWIIGSVIYALTTVSIIALKPCFVSRMMEV